MMTNTAVSLQELCRSEDMRRFWAGGTFFMSLPGLRKMQHDCDASKQDIKIFIKLNVLVKVLIHAFSLAFM